MEKQCKGCGRILALECFSKKSGNKDGLNTRCKECEKARHKQYRKDNPHIQKNYQESHKEQAKEYAREYRKTHPVYDFNHRVKRRIKEEQQGKGFTNQQWKEMMDFFDWKCAYSGIVLTKENRTIDHIIALNQGGEHEIWNLVPMYGSYNFSKKDKDWLEWYQRQDYYTEERLDKIYEWIKYAEEKWGR
jgi:5-methylcytosine-specific restriction endonuclease McrA